MNKYEIEKNYLIELHANKLINNEMYIFVSELVERATPKKLEFRCHPDNGQADLLHCPNCKMGLNHPLYINKEWKNCPYCGQKIGAYNER